ncbi:unnamed protein product [Closterium sp. Yama58-4]|nr:unnamed protein product [Closterium sp. Yama58-4]
MCGMTGRSSPSSTASLLSSPASLSPMPWSNALSRSPSPHPPLPTPLPPPPPRSPPPSPPPSRLSFLLLASPRLSTLSIVGGGCPVTVLNTPHLHSLVAGCIDLSLPHLLSVRHLYLLVEPNALLLRQPTRVLPSGYAGIAAPGSVHGPPDNLSGFLPGFSPAISPGFESGVAGPGSVGGQCLLPEMSSDADESIQDSSTHFPSGHVLHSSPSYSSSSTSGMLNNGVVDEHFSPLHTNSVASTLEHLPISPPSSWLARVAGTVEILVARRVIGQLECGTWGSLRSMAVKCISSRRQHHHPTPPFGLSALHRQQPLSLSGATSAGNSSTAASFGSGLHGAFAAGAAAAAGGGGGQDVLMTQGRMGDASNDLHHPLPPYNPRGLSNFGPPSAIPPPALFSLSEIDSSSEPSLLPLPVGTGLLGFFCCLLGAPCSRASLHTLLLHCPLMRSLHVWVPAAAETWRWDVRSGCVSIHRMDSTMKRCTYHPGGEENLGDIVHLEGSFKGGSAFDFWQDSGGFAQYVFWADPSQNIPYPPSFPDFTGSWQEYIDYASRLYCDKSIMKSAQSMLENHIKTIIQRVNHISGLVYSEDNTIFSWEITNEPQDPPRWWIDRMAKDYSTDFLERHAGYTHILKKPLILEEFGLARDGWEKQEWATPSSTNRYSQGRPSDSGPRRLGDPPHETPGWYSIYDQDASTIKIISNYSVG